MELGGLKYDWDVKNDGTAADEYMRQHRLERDKKATAKLNYMKENGYIMPEGTPLQGALQQLSGGRGAVLTGGEGSLAYEDEMDDLAKPYPERVMVDNIENARRLMPNASDERLKELYLNEYLDNGYRFAKRGLLSTPYQRDRATGMPLYSFENWARQNRGKFQDVDLAIKTLDETRRTEAEELALAQAADARNKRAQLEQNAEKMWNDMMNRFPLQYDGGSKEEQEAAAERNRQRLVAERAVAQAKAQKAQQQAQQSKQQQRGTASGGGKQVLTIDDWVIYDTAKKLRDDFADVVDKDDWKQILDTKDDGSKMRRDRVRQIVESDPYYQARINIINDPQSSPEAKFKAKEANRELMELAILQSIHATDNQIKTITVDGKRDRAVRRGLSTIRENLKDIYGAKKVGTLTDEQKNVISAAMVEAQRDFITAMNQEQLEDTPQAVLNTIAEQYNAKLKKANISATEFPSIYELYRDHIWYNNNLPEFQQASLRYNDYLQRIANGGKQDPERPASSTMSIANPDANANGGTSVSGTSTSNEMPAQTEIPRYPEKLRERFASSDTKFANNPILYNYMRKHFLPLVVKTQSELKKIRNQRNPQEDMRIGYY